MAEEVKKVEVKAAEEEPKKEIPEEKKEKEREKEEDKAAATAPAPDEKAVVVSESKRHPSSSYSCVCSVLWVVCVFVYLHTTVPPAIEICLFLFAFEICFMKFCFSISLWRYLILSVLLHLLLSNFQSFMPLVAWKNRLFAARTLVLVLSVLSLI